jgi:hypothetical protein
MADIPDQTLNVSAVNTHRVDMQQITDHVDDESPTQINKPTFDLLDFDMSKEQENDDKLMTIKKQLKQDDAFKSISRYVIIDNIFYFISEPDSDPILKLCVPAQLQELVFKHNHSECHLGLDKCYDAIKRKYFWSNLYRHVNDYSS